MTIFDPFADMTQLRRQIDRLVDQAAVPANRAQENRVWRPAVDLFEDEEGLTLKLDLPDIDRGSLDVQITGEELTVKGERKWTAPEKGGCVHSERPYGQFHRAFKLGVPVQNDRVEASYRDGVLLVRLPKAETVKPRKIAVSTESGA
jgi:HSP20 family protein